MAKDFSDNPALAFISSVKTKHTEEVESVKETPQEAEKRPLKREYKMVEKKTKRRQLVLQPSLDEWVEQEAKKKGLSVNGFIHNVLEELMGNE